MPSAIVPIGQIRSQPTIYPTFVTSDSPRYRLTTQLPQTPTSWLTQRDELHLLRLHRPLYSHKTHSLQTTPPYTTHTVLAATGLAVPRGRPRRPVPTKHNKPAVGAPTAVRLGRSRVAAGAREQGKCLCSCRVLTVWRAARPAEAGGSSGPFFFFFGGGTSFGGGDLTYSHFQLSLRIQATLF